jgi:hypothetical protein
LRGGRRGAGVVRAQFHTEEGMTWPGNSAAP